MNFKTTVILVVLLAAAGITLWFTRSSAPVTAVSTDETNPTSVDTGAKFTDIDSKDVTKITIAGDNAMTLEKSGADWRITAPYTAPADTFEVDALLRDITDARTHGQVDPTGGSAAATGLATPKYHVTLTTPAKTLSLAVGSKSAVGDDLYVQLDGNPKADIIPTELNDKLAKGPDALRKTTLVSAGADDIKQLVVTRADGSKLSLAKVGPGWRITAPTPAAADDSAASDLVFALTGLRADSFVDPSNLPKTAMLRPQLTVAYTNAAPITPPAVQPASQPAWTTVRFGGYEDLLKKSVYASVDGTTAVAKVPAASLDSFRKTELDLRDKKVVDLDPASVTRLTVVTQSPASTHPSGPMTVMLERRHTSALMGPVMTTMPATTKPSTAQPASAWVVGSASADDAKVKNLLDALHPLRADKYLALPSPTTSPAIRYVLTVTSRGSPAEQTITLIDPGHDEPLVGTSNGLTFETARALATDLQGNWTHQ